MFRRIRYPMLMAEVALAALPSLAMAQDPPAQDMSRFNVLVPDLRALEGEEEAVARHIYQDFERYTTHLRAAANCEVFAQSNFWDRALENCDEALRLNPDAIGTRYRRARILFETGRPTDALQELARVLEPPHLGAPLTT